MRTIATSQRTAAMMLALLLAMLFCSSIFTLAQAGSLDPTFGTGGIVTTPNTNTGCPGNVNCSIAIQSDGKIVVAGEASSIDTGELAIARYNTNGSLDTTFGSHGIVTYSNSNGVAGAFGLAIQSNGKIVAAGAVGFDLAVFRFNTNGTLDTTFGTGGIVETTAAGLVFSPVLGGLGILPDGKIVVANGPVIIRLLTDGALDSSFGTGGVARLLSTAQSMSLLSNGGALVASQVSFSTGAATLYTSTGSLSSSFGVAGQIANFGSMAAILPLSNGKIVMGGTLAKAAPASSGSVATQGFVVTRYNSNGGVDNTFGTHGANVATFPNEGYATVLALAVQSDGDIVAAGFTQLNNPGFGSTSSDFALARYTTSGQLDTTFGTNGLVTTAFGSNGGNLAQASGLAIQSDGKIVVVGFDGSSTNNNGFTLARYLSQ